MFAQARFRQYVYPVERLLFCLLLITSAAGCSGSGLVTFPVSGQVTLDGEPLADASVLFMPVEPGPVASGNTDQQGRFTLVTAGQDGAVPGEHHVIVTKEQVSGVTVDESGLEDEVAASGARLHSLIPARYGKAESSGLTATVSAESTEFTFPLESK